MSFTLPDGLLAEMALLEEQRQEVLGKRTKAYVIMAVFALTMILGGLGIGLGLREAPFFIPMIFGGVIAILGCAIMHHFLLGKHLAAYGLAFKERAGSALVRAMEPGLEYHPEGGIHEEEFTASGLFRRPDRYSFEDYVHGNIGDTAIRFSEVHAKERQTSGSGKNRKVKYVTFFHGIFFIADFHKEFQGRTQVMPDTAEKAFGFLGKALQGFRPFSSDELIYMEDPVFEKEFVVHGTDQVEARYILSPSMMERIVALQAHWGRVRMAFQGSKVIVAIDHRKNWFEPDLKVPADEPEQVVRIASELQEVFDLVEALNLNTRIWSKA